MKIGRNQPCPCGSGLKFKRCHGAIAPGPSPGDVRRILDRHSAEQRIRERQQGLGRPVVAGKVGEHQMVAIGNRLMYSKKWKTFIDFLGDYIRDIFGGDWGNAEIAKPLAERHPLMQWYDAYCRYQLQVIKQPGVVSNSPVNGVVACYLGVAYGLYQLAHNVELQERMVHRLKDPGNFQGAYYELLVANVLIQAGFELVLEDETDGTVKHCEYSARSKRTGKKYWVEAKMRGVAGLLGRTSADGGPNDRPLGSLIPHLNAALAKPAQDERLIFIDLNAEMAPTASEANPPDFADEAIRRLQRYDQKGRSAGANAYVFVTNISFHRDLLGTPGLMVAAYGLGISDFNKPGYYRMSDRYMQEQKHRDAFNIAQAFTGLTKFPTTFEGMLPSQAYDGSERVLIGEVYDFGGDIGTALVTAASMMETKKVAMFGVTRLEDNQSMLIEKPVTDAELADYREYSDAYFGRLQPEQKNRKTPYELFEWLVEVYRPTMTRGKLLEQMKGRPDLAELEKLSDEHLLAVYCEGMTAAFQAQTGKKSK